MPVDFPQRRNYSRGIGDAWRPSKTKVGSCHDHQTSPELGKTCQQPMTTTHFPFSHSSPLWPTRFLDCNERNMEEIGGREQGWANFQERARLSAILWAVQGRIEIILGGVLQLLQSQN